MGVLPIRLVICGLLILGGYMASTRHMLAPFDYVPPILFFLLAALALLAPYTSDHPRKP
jgi:hypothetical protein